MARAISSRVMLSGLWFSNENASAPSALWSAACMAQMSAGPKTCCFDKRTCSVIARPPIILVCRETNLRCRKHTVQNNPHAALREFQNGRIAAAQNKKGPHESGPFFDFDSTFSLVRHRFDNVVDHLLGVAEQHHRVVAEEQL